jgi:hypothetical protein
MVKNEGIFQHIVILDYIFERNLENYFKPHLSSTNLLQFRDAQERRFYASAVNRLADLNYKSYARSRIILSLVGQSQDITAHGGCLNSCEYSIHDRSPIAAIHETKVNMRTDLSLLWLAQLKGANVNNWTIGYTKAFFGVVNDASIPWPPKGPCPVVSHIPEKMFPACFPRPPRETQSTFKSRIR